MNGCKVNSFSRDVLVKKKNKGGDDSHPLPPKGSYKCQKRKKERKCEDEDETRLDLPVQHEIACGKLMITELVALAFEAGADNVEGKPSQTCPGN